ncbi:MAG: alpha-hydroxy-acid oxidizing protein, partial [Proteobacteria bacterium]|nr:alpha-hydroxy-acid oxidizing protein [Pseudomonadota bacterium]
MSTTPDPPLPPLEQVPPQIAAIGDYDAFARDRMSKAVWAWLSGGAADEITLRENAAAFSRLRLQGRVLSDLAGGDTRVSLFGDVLQYPVLLAPIPYHKLVHPHGELGTVLGASALKAGMVVSMQSSVALEDIARVAQTPLWFQLCLQHDRGYVGELLQRVEAAGYRALMVSVDAPVSGVRNREQRAGFALPEEIGAVNLAGMPAIPTQTARAGEASLFDSPLIAAAPTWRDIEWLQSQTSLPVVLKGVMSARDAVRAAETGVSGLVVSNHGGRTLDTLPATIDALPRIAQALNGRLPLLLDGGI